MADNPYSPPNSELISHQSERVQENRPRLWVKLCAALTGLLLGVVTGPFVGYALVIWSNDCKSGPGEPCDGVGLLVLFSAVVLAAFFGTVFSVVGYWLARRHETRRAA